MWVPKISAVQAPEYCNIEELKSKYHGISQSIECLEAVLDDIKTSTWNTELYEETYSRLEDLCRREGVAASVPFDEAWVNEVRKRSKDESVRLEAQLSTALTSREKGKMR
ncbi:hypothetical protein EV182_008129, partial [Spiromyces aspiralis]